MVAAGAISLKYRTWIEHSHTGSQVSPNPFHIPIFAYYGSFGVEIVGIDRPIFDGCVSHLCSLAYIYFYESSMETRSIVFGCRASLDVVSSSVILDDHECVLKLSSCSSIHPEVCLERLSDLDSLRNIQKCPTRPYRSM